MPCQWQGCDGEFSLTDADEVIVCLRGKDVQLWAEGAGLVTLTGHGHYETGGEGVPDGEGRWTLSGVSIQLGQ